MCSCWRVGIRWLAVSAAWCCSYFRIGIRRRPLALLFLSRLAVERSLLLFVTLVLLAVAHTKACKILIGGVLLPAARRSPAQCS